MKNMRKIIWVLLSLPFFFSAYAESNQAPSVVAGGGEENNGMIKKIYDFQDWQVECVLQRLRDANNKETEKMVLASCSSVKEYKIGDGEQSPYFVFATTFERDEKGVSKVPTIYILSPLGVFLEPVYVRVDQKDPFVIPYRVCERRGCTAIIRLDDERTKQFKTGSNVDIRIFFDIRQKEPSAYSMPLKGSTAAFEFMMAAMEKQGQEVSIADLDGLAKK